ncbi:RlpA-like double-psi beta-barrel domain-containing protein [Deinococcus detaillensis]|uniref:hypothetical protein n=1 Tax=Deinococcus detaillensis TaxID=2592048 RepID=UPI001CDB92AD|nr:hypothetical protein [Deinococcus detaillensis]
MTKSVQSKPLQTVSTGRPVVMVLGLAGAAALALSTLGTAQVTGDLILPQLPEASLTQTAVQSMLGLGEPALPDEVAASRTRGATRTVKATAYNSEAGQTDNSPFVTATGTRVRPGVIALSRDLLRIFPYGSRVTLQDSAGLLNGRVFIVEDTMNVRMANTVDIWMGSRAQALAWGSRTVRITALR